MDSGTLLELVGIWKGKYTLWKSPDDFPEVSDSILTIKSELFNKFINFGYTWLVDDRPQEGSIKLSFNAKRSLFTAFWIDSWHRAKVSCPVKDLLMN